MATSQDSGYEEWVQDQTAQFLKGTVWKCGTDNSGRKFYYDKVAKKSQWKAPAEVLEFEKTLTRDSYSSVRPKSTEELLSVLGAKDSILEAGIVAVSKQLINNHGVPAADVKSMLVDNYVGYPSMIKIALEISRLTSLLEAGQRQASSSRYTSTSSTAQRIQHIESSAYLEEQLLPLLSDQVSKLYNRKLADELVKYSAEEDLPVLPTYVHAMVQNPTIRQTLVDLYQVNEHSAFLKACCTGAYSVDTSESATRDDSQPAPALKATTTTETGGLADFAERVCWEARQFLRVKELLSTAMVGARVHTHSNSCYCRLIPTCRCRSVMSLSWSPLRNS
jgi:hypothetical protein